MKQIKNFVCLLVFTVLVIATTVVGVHAADSEGTQKRLEELQARVLHDELYPNDEPLFTDDYIVAYNAQMPDEYKIYNWSEWELLCNSKDIEPNQEDWLEHNYKYMYGACK